MVAMFVFSRRAQTSMFAQAEGTPGAAAWVLQNNLRGDWRTTPAIAGTSQLDAVHRLVGRPGVVLVGEGAPHRVRGLIAQEKKKIARLAGDTPIYDVIVGTGEGEVPLRKLNNHLFKLPRNLSKDQVGVLDKRLQALGGGKPPLPQGPMPTAPRSATCSEPSAAVREHSRARSSIAANGSGSAPTARGHWRRRAGAHRAAGRLRRVRPDRLAVRTPLRTCTALPPGCPAPGASSRWRSTTSSG